MEYVKRLIGVLIAFSLLWLAGAWFCNSHYLLVPQPELGGIGFPDGSQVKWKSEGRGSSYFGKWGLSSIPDIERFSASNIIVWGDSYVEALQVDDQYKMAQQLTHRLRCEGVQTNVVAVGVGLSGQSVADYLLKLPLYEDKLGSVVAHVIVIGQIEDLFPDQSSAHYARFVSTPELHVVPAEPPSFSSLKWMVYKWGLRLNANGMLSMLRRYSNGLNLRFRMGPIEHTTKEIGKTASTAEMNEWFEFYASAFRESTNKPLIIVYMPTIPRLVGNEWNFTDQDGQAVCSMERIFSDYGWRVINMEERFNKYYKSTGQLPRGFPNSQPGSGHLNRDGHSLVAEEIAEALLQR